MSNFFDPAKHSLELEIKALHSILNNNLDETFEKVVKTIIKTKGRVILSAIGKPGYIAHKCAATLASTGTPAFYIHPAEASHGDLGMISKDDTVILLSSSGGSKELNDIMTYCKRFDITLIGITRTADSTLGQAADIKVVLEKVEETNPVDSPTTSMLMMLAYMDAIITTLIKEKKFNKDKYKNFHPGGKLGANLLKVYDIMRTGNDIPIVKENASMAEILDEMINKNIGSTAVVDENNKIVGIIADGDLKRKLKIFPDLMSKKAKEVMTKDPVTVEKDDFALDAINIMSNGINDTKKYLQVLFVVNKKDNDIKGKIEGVLHIQDCFKAGII